MFLISVHCFRQSIIHNSSSSSEKIIWSESGEKSAQIKRCLQSKSVRNRKWTFSLEEVLLWIMARSDNLKLKHLNDGFVSYKHSFCLLKMLIDGLESCGLLVDYCDVFISCLDSHSDGTHSLQRIHC